MTRFRRVWRVAGSLIVVLLITAYTRILQVNPTTVALSYLVAILPIATGWGIAEATAASIAAALCLDFFFLPPVGTLFTIADSQNWVALFAFLLTAVITSQVSGRAKRRLVETIEKEHGLERLYALSRALLLSERGSVPGAMARHIAETFHLRAVTLYDRRADSVSRGGRDELPDVTSSLRDVARTGVMRHDSSGVVITPIRLGAAPMGSVAVAEGDLSDAVLQSVTNLAAIGLERGRADEATARAEAARESSELRATILDALAHEFKTPLTSMKAASSELLASTDITSRDRELVTIIDEDLDRFQRLVTDAVRMLRIDAGQFVIRLDRHRLRDIVASTLEQAAARLDGHQVIVDVPDALRVDADRDLLALALRQLVDNALKYSPPDSRTRIGAAANGTVTITVQNSGSTIPEPDQARVFERFYRAGDARHVPGTGMGLAIVQRIAQAHGGDVAVSSAPADGTTFILTLPREGARS